MSRAPVLSVAVAGAALALLAPAPAFAAPLWSAPVTLAGPTPTLPALESSTQMDVDAAGNQTAAWIAVGANGNGVYTSTRAPGRPWTVPQLVTGIAAGVQVNGLVLDVASTGTAVIAWISRTGLAGDQLATPWLATRTAAGPWSAPLILDTGGPAGTETDFAFGLSASVSPAGEVWASWLRPSEAAQYGFEGRFARRAPGASPFAFEFDTRFKDAVPAKSWFDTAGNATMLVSGPAGQLSAATRSPDGQWTDAILLEAVPAPDDSPLAYQLEEADFSIGENGAVTVFWVLRVEDGYVIESARRPVGGAWSEPKRVTASPLFAPQPTDLSAAQDAQGRATLAWLQVRPGSTYPGGSEWESRVWAATSDDDGDWSTPQAVSPTLSQGAIEGDQRPVHQDLEVAIGAAGHGLLTWTTRAGAYASERRPGEAWATPSFLPDTAGVRTRALAARVDAAGTATALWSTQDGRLRSAVANVAAAPLPARQIKVSGRVLRWGSSCPLTLTASALGRTAHLPTLDDRNSAWCTTQGAIQVPGSTRLGTYTIVSLSGAGLLPSWQFGRVTAG